MALLLGLALSPDARARSPTADGFNPHPSDAYLGVPALAVQADAKILVGGGFTTLVGQPREKIGRLKATDPSTESLTSDGSTLTWLRGGSSPEVWRTTFEHSPDGTNWTSLGDGTRIPGGWGLTGLSLPPGGTIRARGYVTGGQYNGSGWFVETTLEDWSALVQTRDDDTCG